MPPAYPGSSDQIAARSTRIEPVASTILHLLGLALILAAAAIPCNVLAASTPQERLENELKAAFIYQFGGYIDWPEGVFSDPEEPLVIGVVDGDDIADPLSAIIRNRTINSRPLTLRRIGANDDPTGVHILFIGAGLRTSLVDGLLERARGHPVLTVVDSGQAVRGIINFIIDQDRVRFDVSLTTAQASDLRISSRLLSVARRVEGAAP